MNAYELTKDRADILADELLAYHHKGVCGRAAKMLRQQADRIAELEKLLEHSVGSDCREMRYIQEIENKDARIAELEKQTKPLSDEEIDSIIYSVDWAYDPVLLARAIEERHGIK